MNAAWAYPFIFVAGVSQAVGAAMGGEPNKSLGNPWLATSISFMLILFLTVALFACMPRRCRALATSRQCRGGRRSAGSPAPAR